MVSEVQIKPIFSEIMYIAANEYIDALINTLREYNVPSSWYSVKEAKDNAICLLNTGDVWEVFHSERGEADSLNQFDNIKDACYEVINRLAEDDVEQNDMNNIFENHINKIDESKGNSISKTKQLFMKFMSSVATF